MQPKDPPPGKLREVLGGNRFFGMTAKNRRHSLLKKIIRQDGLVLVDLEEFV